MRRRKTIIIATVLFFVFASFAIALPDYQVEITYYDFDGNAVGGSLQGCSSYTPAYWGDTSGATTLTSTTSCHDGATYTNCDPWQTPVYYDHNVAPSYCASSDWIGCYGGGGCGHAESLHPDQW
jgi:hypothetical protein